MYLTHTRLLAAIALLLVATVTLLALGAAHRNADRRSPSRVQDAATSAAIASVSEPGVEQRYQELVTRPSFRDAFLERCSRERSRSACECLLENLGPRNSPAAVSRAAAGGRTSTRSAVSDVELCR